MNRDLRLFFRIHYSVGPNEVILICGNVVQLGQWNINRALEMRRVSADDYWIADLTVNNDQLLSLDSPNNETKRTLSIEYKFIVSKEKSFTEIYQSQSVDRFHYSRWEESSHKLYLTVDYPVKEKNLSVYIDNIWNSPLLQYLEQPLQIPVRKSEPLEITTEHNHPYPLDKRFTTITFVVKCDTDLLSLTTTSNDNGDISHKLMLASNLHDWNTDHAVQMTRCHQDNGWFWSCTVQIPLHALDSFRYKYLLRSTHNNGLLWERSEGRSLDVATLYKSLVVPSLIIRSDPPFKTPTMNEGEAIYDMCWLRTGYLGLKNTFASCAINSVTQTLFHILPFRTSILHYGSQFPRIFNAVSPIIGNEKSSGFPLNPDEDHLSVALAAIFKELQCGSLCPATKYLIPFFGLPEDVQEFLSLVCARIEIEMNKHPFEAGIEPNQKNVIERLFTGKLLQKIRCPTVNFQSSLVENFRDLSVDLMNENLYTCLDQFFSVETLDGDSKLYIDDQLGYQAAERKTSVVELPEIMTIHLKRFLYGSDGNVKKVMNRLVYPEHLDMSLYCPENAQYSSYRLFGVIVHDGDQFGNEGHFYVHLRLKDQWFKFDDEKVLPISNHDVFEANYGDYPDQDGNYHQTTHAYMLWYAKENVIDEYIS